MGYGLRRLCWIVGSFAWSTAQASSLSVPQLATASPSTAVSATPGSVRLAVIGDFGQDGEAEAQVAALVKTWDPHLIVTVGDNNYPNGEAKTIDDNIGKYYAPYIAFNPNYQGPYRHMGSATPRFSGSARTGRRSSSPTSTPT